MDDLWTRSGGRSRRRFPDRSISSSLRETPHRRFPSTGCRTKPVDRLPAESTNGSINSHHICDCIRSHKPFDLSLPDRSPARSPGVLAHRRHRWRIGGSRYDGSSSRSGFISISPSLCRYWLFHFPALEYELELLTISMGSDRVVYSPHRCGWRTNHRSLCRSKGRTQTTANMASLSGTGPIRQHHFRFIASTALPAICKQCHAFV